MSRAYELRILATASRELERLDPVVAQRLVDRIRWLQSNMDAVRLKALKGPVAGLFKLREGSYRTLFEILHDDRAILIHSIGHRREIYRSR